MLPGLLTAGGVLLSGMRWRGMHSGLWTNSSSRRGSSSVVVQMHAHERHVYILPNAKVDGITSSFPVMKLQCQFFPVVVPKIIGYLKSLHISTDLKPAAIERV
jgi:hypothetical protein